MKKAFVISSLLVVLTLSLGGTVASKSTDGSPTYEQLRLFTEVLSIVQNQYVDEIPPKDLIYNAIKGTLRGLDPHSSFLDPESYREMQVETSGSFGGLGIEITLRDDVLTVVAPIEGTPAHRAGLHPADLPPLAEIPQLRSLDLRYNGLTDVSAVTSLEGLAVDNVGRRETKNILVTLQPVFRSQRRNTALQRLVSRQAISQVPDDATQA